MRKITLSLGELMLLVGTRALLGAGVGLLVSEHLAAEPRKAAGWTLVLVGALTALPLGLDVSAAWREAAHGDRAERELS